MAANASSRMKSSEETFDYTCSLCLKKNKVCEAAKYCQECHKHMCTSCLEHHDYYMEGHNLVKPSAAGGVVVLPTERCKQHGGEVVKLWCKQHDEVLCNTCVTINHRFCEEVKFIPNETEKLLQDSEVRQTIDDLKKTREQLTTLKNERSLAGKELLIEKNKYLDMVKQYQKKIIQRVEALGEATRDEINAWYKESKSLIDEDQDYCDHLEDDTSASLQQLETSSENKPQLFISMKNGQKLITTIKEVTGQRDLRSSSKYMFEINLNLEEHLDSFESLGSILKRKKMYKATGVKRVNICADQDSRVCDIFDSCLLSDGSVLVTDHENKKLKRLDNSTFTVIETCDLPESPRGLCCVGQQEVAVCLAGRKKIQFVSVSNRMTLTRSIAVKHNCCGIAHSDLEVFVSDANQKVYVYSLTGSLLRTFSNTPSGMAMFSRAVRLDVIGDRIFVADGDKGVICIDKKGREMFRYKDALIEDLCGICTDGQRALFLCGKGSHNLVQVSADGKELGVVLTQADGLRSPRSVRFITSKLMLIVSNRESDEILVANLTCHY